MKLNTFSVRLLSAAAPTSLLLACNRNTDPQPTASLYNDGVFVINEGNFSQNNGTLSWIPRTGGAAQNNLFKVRNGRDLTGSVAGYMEAGNKGIILVDNAAPGLDKIEIVTADSLRSVKTLAAPDVENPRDAARISDTKAYITCWGATGTTVFFPNPGCVAVVDLATNTITKKITVQRGAENIAVIGNEAYITSATYSGANVVTVIDTQTDVVKQQIAMPADVDRLQRDANSKLWAFMGKNAVRLNPTTKTIEATVPVSTTMTGSPSGLASSADGQSMYYKLGGRIYRFAITDATITPTTPIVNRSFTGFTGLGFDTKTNVLYAGITPSYSQAGYVYRYQASGQLIDSLRVEVAPTEFYIK